MDTNSNEGKDMRATKRRWIKIYPSETLNGSIRYQLSSAERGIWYDLMCFSALCSNTGDICDRDGKPYPLQYIANRLNVKVNQLKECLLKCISEGRITEDDNGLHLVNWNKYQSEYDRQKPYRQAKKKHEREVFGEIAGPVGEDLPMENENETSVDPEDSVGLSRLVSESKKKHKKQADDAGYEVV